MSFLQTVQQGHASLLRSESQVKEVSIIGSNSQFGSNSMNFGYPGTEVNYRQEVGDPWSNSVVSICVNWIWLNMMETTVQLERQVDINRWVPEPGKVNDRIRRSILEPNEEYDETQLWGVTVLTMACKGVSYWLKRRREIGDNTAGGYWYVPPWCMEPVLETSPGPRLTKGYNYRPLSGGATTFIKAEDVVSFKWMMHPRNPLQGVEPIYAQMREVFTDNQTSHMVATLAKNMGMPGIIFVPKEKVKQTPKDRRLLATMWRRFTRDSIGEPAVLPLPTDIHSPSYSPDQMGWDKSKSMAANRICAGFNLDPMAVKLPSENKTYSNYEEANRAAMYDCLIPFLRILGKQFGRSILPEYGLDTTQYRLGWNIDQIKGLQEDLDRLHRRVRDDFQANVITLNQALKDIGREEIGSAGEVRYYQLEIKVNESKAPTDPVQPSKPKKSAEVAEDAGLL